MNIRLSTTHKLLKFAFKVSTLAVLISTVQGPMYSQYRNILSFDCLGYGYIEHTGSRNDLEIQFFDKYGDVLQNLETIRGQESDGKTTIKLNMGDGDCAPNSFLDVFSSPGFYGEQVYFYNKSKVRYITIRKQDNGGNDGFWLDQLDLRADKGGNHWGVNKGNGFCFSSEPEISEENWANYIDSTGCHSSFTFDVETGKSWPGDKYANIARGKPTTQSSDYSRDAGQAYYAVDGDTDGYYAGGSVTHTKEEQSASWQVDLGEVYDIKNVIVFNRTDCCEDRLSGFDINVKDTAEHGGFVTRTHKFASCDSMTSRSENFKGSARGRYVQIKLRGKNYLSLAEVEVYGTKFIRKIEEDNEPPPKEVIFPEPRQSQQQPVVEETPHNDGLPDSPKDLEGKAASPN